MVEIFENIRKIYRFRDPCNELANYVDFFSESSPDATRQLIGGDNFSVKMFPSWTPTFYINLGQPYALTIDNQTHFISKDQDILILRNSIVERHNSNLDHIFTVKFFPGGLEAIFDIPQASLINEVVYLDLVLPKTLIKKVKQLQLFEDRVAVLQQFFTNQLKRRNDRRFRFVMDAVAAYSETDMLLKVDELASNFATSTKTFNRNFHSVVGTSPKTYFSTVRARTAITAYVNKENTFTPSAFGYFDMSHFYKDVLNFTGQKLTDYTRIK
jgi:AraC-like DNA-binding protein